WINIDRGTIEGHLSDAVAAILWRILGWVADEEVAVLAARKQPRRPQPVIGKLLGTLHRPPFGEIGDRVVPHDRNTAEIAGIDRVGGEGRNATDYQGDREHRCKC